MQLTSSCTFKNKERTSGSTNPGDILKSQILNRLNNLIFKYVARILVLIKLLFILISLFSQVYNFLKFNFLIKKTVNSTYLYHILNIY